MANLLCVTHEWQLGFDAVRSLANAGFYLIPAANGYEGLQKFVLRDIDAVVINRRLPDISVEDFVRFARHHKPELPVVMVSAEMPLPQAPALVDAVIGKHSAAELLAPTLDVLMGRVTERSLPEEQVLPRAA